MQIKNTTGQNPGSHLLRGEQFAPASEGAKAKWLGYDTRHRIAEIRPKPDQVTIAIGTAGMNRAAGFEMRWLRDIYLTDAG